MKDLIEVPSENPDEHTFVSKYDILDVVVRPLEIEITYKDDTILKVIGTAQDRSKLDSMLDQLELGQLKPTGLKT